MKIVFDHQTFTMQPYGGISRYFVRLAQSLITLGEQVEVTAPIHRNRYLRDLPKSNVYGLMLNRFPPKTGSLAMLANHYLSQHKLRNFSPDILHETYYSAAPVITRDCGRVITVYDMIHEKYPSYFTLRDPAMKYKRLAVDRADHVICISHSTKNDLCEIFEVPSDKVSVVHLGFEKFVCQRTKTDPQAEGFRPFLLYVGSRGGYKNFQKMLKAVASRSALKRTFDVVAFGGGSLNKAEINLIAQLGFEPNTVRQVDGGDEVLGQLYTHARAFVYPSLYEGFGLPPLEAMAHDCPVISSNSSSMPEVIGEAGMYFEPLDIEAQAQAIEDVVFDEKKISQLITAGRKRLGYFSWNRCARETQDIYQKLLTAKEFN